MVKIYTTDTCPRCKVLKVKMDAKGIPYESITDVDEIQKMYDFKTANLAFEKMWNYAIYMHDFNTATFISYCGLMSKIK